jgi:adenylate cyclase
MTKPNPSSTEDDRLHRMLLAYVRQEFEAPVGAILGYAEIMLEDAEQQGHHSILGDLRRLHQAGSKLEELVSGLLDPTAMHQDFTDFRRNLRHDLRTPISAIKGFGEMLLEDAQEANNEALAHDLEKMLEAGSRLLARIDTLVDFTGTSVPAATGGNPESAAVAQSSNRSGRWRRPLPAKPARAVS